MGPRYIFDLPPNHGIVVIESILLRGIFLWRGIINRGDRIDVDAAYIGRGGG